jgi:hypothetical protein
LEVGPNISFSLRFFKTFRDCKIYLLDIQLR